MAITKIISAVVFASAVALLNQTTPDDARICACQAMYLLPSDYAEMGAVVVRAKVLSRSSGTAANDDVTYKAGTTTLYAGESDVDYGRYISFVTEARYYCGGSLGIGRGLVLSLFRRTSTSASDSDDEDQPLALDACDLHTSWSSLSEEEKADLATLLEGSDNEDVAI